MLRGFKSLKIDFFKKLFSECWYDDQSKLNKEHKKLSLKIY